MANYKNVKIEIHMFLHKIGKKNRDIIRAWVKLNNNPVITLQKCKNDIETFLEKVSFNYNNTSNSNDILQGQIMFTDGTVVTHVYVEDYGQWFYEPYHEPKE